MIADHLTGLQRDDASGTEAKSSLVGRHVVWPPERFYWAMLDASSLPRQAWGNQRREQLGYLLENVVPQPLEELHATFVQASPGPPGCWIGCAVPIAALDEIAPDTLTLRPGALPAFLGECPVHPSRFNLLHGRFTPEPLRRLRRRAWLEAACLIVLLAALLITGLERRRLSCEDEIRAVAAAQQDVFLHVLGAAAQSKSQPPPLQLLAELRSLRQTRQGGLSIEPAPDMTAHLAALLTSWPAEGEVRQRTQSLALTPTSMTLRSTAPDTSEAQRFIESIQRATGWRGRQPSIRAGREGVEIEILLTPREATP